MRGKIQGANEPCIGEELRHSEEQWQLRHEFSMQPMLRTISADKSKERSLVQVNSLAKKIPEGESDIHDIPSICTIIEVTYSYRLVLPIQVIQLEIEVDQPVGVMRYWEHLKRGGNLLEFRPNRRLLFRKRCSDQLQMISPGAPCGQSRASIALYG